MKNWIVLSAGLLLSSVSALAQNATPPGTNVSVVVTAEPKHGKTIADLTAQDIAVTEERQKRPIVSLEPLNNAKLQVLLMLDESAAGSFDTELTVLKNFINALPQNSEIAVGYMRNGLTDIACNFTADHAAAANSIRLPIGPAGADVSPWDSISDAVKKWPDDPTARREVVMISGGIEGLGGGLNGDNPYVNAGIESAQKAGLVIYAIYSPSAGHAGHSFWRSTWGQNFLSQTTDETGGEFYGIGYGSPVSFEPFLNSILEGFKHQYRVTFIARPEKKATLRQVKISVIEKDASLAAPDKVFVKAGL